MENQDGEDMNRWLDSITLKSYYEEELGLPPQVTSFYDPIMASIIGLGCDGISAYWGKYFDMPGFKNQSYMMQVFYRVSRVVMQVSPGILLKSLILKQLKDPHLRKFCLVELRLISWIMTISPFECD